VVHHYLSLLLLFVLHLVLVAAEVILDRFRRGTHGSHKCVRFVAARTAERKRCSVWRNEWGQVGS